MFKLKYKITDSDMKSLNKSLMWQYFIPYICVALAGLASGIAATVTRPRTEMLVLGIILIVLAVILAACSVMLLIAPKNFVASALLTSDDTEREVEFGDVITVRTEGQSDIIISYSEINKIKDKKTYAVAFLPHDEVFIIKDAIVEGGTYAELLAFVRSKKAAEKPADQNAAAESENAPAEVSEAPSVEPENAPAKEPVEQEAEQSDEQETTEK